ncbi:MAG TPA: hypothetical protein VK530_01175 [Candidatus Acidoferrum sp.]|nr:hypothetical protein [Candidatus Acidoferrum sp.]
MDIQTQRSTPELPHFFANDTQIDTHKSVAACPGAPQHGTKADLMNADETPIGIDDCYAVAVSGAEGAQKEIGSRGRTRASNLFKRQYLILKFADSK